MGFNPDEFLEEPLPAKKQESSFNPDEFLSDSVRPVMPEELKNPISSGPVGIAARAVGDAGNWALNKLKKYGGENSLRAGMGQMLNPSIEDIKRGDLASQAGQKAIAAYGMDSDKVPSDVELAGNIQPPVAQKVARFGLGQIASAPTNLELNALGSKAIDLAKRGGSKLGHALTGIPEKSIETYVKRPENVKSLMSKYGEDTATAGDELQSEVMNALKGHKEEQNNIIKTALENTPRKKVTSIDEVTRPLFEAKAKIDPDLYPTEHKQIDAMIEAVMKKGDENGLVDTHDLQNLKKWFYEHSNYAPQNSPFNVLDQTELAAKSAGRNAREIMDKAGPRDIYDANRKLEALHGASDSLNQFLKTQKPEVMLRGAGAGTNPRLYRDLKNAGEMVGQDFTTPVEDFAAYRDFKNPDILPTDTTGKTGARINFAKHLMGAGGTAVGGLVGGVPGATAGGAAGYLAGGVASSPLAVKSAIDIGRPVANAIGSVPFKMAGANIASQAKNDITSPAIPSDQKIIQKVQNSRYAAPIMNAAKRGENSVGAAHFLLYSQDPEYRKLFDDNNQGP